MTTEAQQSLIVADRYIPTASDLLEMSLYSFAEHAEELRSKFDTMTPGQRQAFIRICTKIASMGQRDAA